MEQNEIYKYPFKSLAKLFVDSKDPEYVGTWVETYQTNEKIRVEAGNLKIYVRQLELWYTVPIDDVIIYINNSDEFTTTQILNIKNSLIKEEIDILL